MFDGIAEHEGRKTVTDGDIFTELFIFFYCFFLMI